MSSTNTKDKSNNEKKIRLFVLLGVQSQLTFEFSNHGHLIFAVQKNNVRLGHKISSEKKYI